MTKSLLKILSSSVVTQALGILIMPFLVNSYKPEQIALLAFFTAFVGVASVFLTMKCENQLFQVGVDEDARAYAVFICCAALILCVLCAPMAYFFSDTFDDLASGMIVVFLLGSLFFAIHNVLLNLLLRFNATSPYSISKVVRSGSEFLCYVVCLLALFDELALVVSSILAYLLAFSYSAKCIFKHVGCFQIWGRVKKGCSLFFDMKGNIGLDFLSSLLNAVSINMPVIYFGMAGDPKLAGIYFMITRFLSAPLLLIGQSVSAALKGHAFAEKKKKNGVMSSVNYTLRLLFIYFAPAYVVITLVVYFGFPVFFGPEWQGITEISLIMLPYIFSRFLFNCLSGMVYVIGEFRANLLFQAALFVVSLMVFYLPVFEGLKIEAYSTGLAACYLLFAFYVVARCRRWSLS